MTQKNKIDVYIIWLKYQFHNEIKMVCTLWGKIKYFFIYFFTWLQACFLGDMRVIWYNSLGDSLFQIYVMNNVEIMIDYYLLITSHVSHAITSCIHKLFFTKLSAWYCVWIIFCHPRLNVPWFWCKICLMFEFLGTKRLKNLFLEDLGWIHVFLKKF